MAEFSFPFSSGAGASVSETDWSHMGRNLQSQGIIGDPGSAVVQCYADGSGRHVFVRAGMSLVRGHMYVNDGSPITDLAIAANASGNPRTDAVVLRLDPGTANSIIAAVVTGTPGVGAPAPALTQTDAAIFEQLVALVAVPAGAVTTTAGQVTDQRQHSGMDVVPCRIVADLPTPVRFGTVAAELTTGLIKWYNGSAWSTLNLLDTGRVTSGFSATAGWTVQAGASYRKLNGIIAEISIDFIAGSSISITANAKGQIADTAIGSVPSAVRPPAGRNSYGIFNCQGKGDGSMYITPGGTVILSTYSGDQSILATDVIHINHVVFTA